MGQYLDPARTVGDIVAEKISRSRVLEEHGIDYCCGGDTPFGEACAAKGLDAAAISREIEAADSAQDSEDSNYLAMPLSRLCDEIECTHHVYMKRELPRLTDLLEKTYNAHRERHPELMDVGRVYQALRMELEGHLMKEEQVLFPMIRQIEVSSEMPRFHCGSMSAPISVMEHEHVNAGAALAKMRELTGHFTAPDDACNTYRAAMEGLREMELDLHQHIHKENNILFPRALEAEAELN